MSSYIVSAKSLAIIIATTTRPSAAETVLGNFFSEARNLAGFSDGLIDDDLVFSAAVSKKFYSTDRTHNYKLLTQILGSTLVNHVNDSYPNQTQTNVNDYIKQVCELKTLADASADSIKYIEVLKHLNNFSYQINDMPDYDKSLAKLFVSIAKELLVYADSEYQSISIFK